MYIKFSLDTSFRFTDLKMLRILDMLFQLQLCLIFWMTTRGMGSTLVRKFLECTNIHRGSLFVYFLNWGTRRNPCDYYLIMWISIPNELFTRLFFLSCNGLTSHGDSTWLPQPTSCDLLHGVPWVVYARELWAQNLALMSAHWFR